MKSRQKRMFSRVNKTLFNPKYRKFLGEVGRLSAEKAIKESKALGLPITYVEDGKIYREEPNGKRVVVGEI